jgi:hypothetical protein
MSGALPVQPLYVFMTCTRVTTPILHFLIELLGFIFLKKETVAVNAMTTSNLTHFKWQILPLRSSLLLDTRVAIAGRGASPNWTAFTKCAICGILQVENILSVVYLLGGKLQGRGLCNNCVFGSEHLVEIFKWNLWRNFENRHLYIYIYIYIYIYLWVKRHLFGVCGIMF